MDKTVQRLASVNMYQAEGTSRGIFSLDERVSGGKINAVYFRRDKNVIWGTNRTVLASPGIII